MTEENNNTNLEDITDDLLKRLLMLRDGGVDFIPTVKSATEERPKLAENIIEATCTACELSDYRKNVVTGRFLEGEGKKARLMVVLDTPSKAEDESGRLFHETSPESELVDNIIKAMGSGEKGLSKTEVFICYSVRCYSDSFPTPEIIDVCLGHIKNDIKRVKPEAILAFGSVAATAVTNACAELKFKNYFKVPGLAETVKDPTLKIETWDKVQKIMKII